MLTVCLSTNRCVSKSKGNIVAPTLDVTDILSAIKRIPSPTVLFLKAEHIQSLTSSVINHAKKSSFIYPLAWRHKFAGLREGFLSKDSLWDRTVFDGAREVVLGKMAETLKAVVISGGVFLLFLDNNQY